MAKKVKRTSFKRTSSKTIKVTTIPGERREQLLTHAGGSSVPRGATQLSSNKIAKDYPEGALWSALELTSDHLREICKRAGILDVQTITDATSTYVFCRNHETLKRVKEAVAAYRP